MPGAIVPNRVDVAAFQRFGQEKGTQLFVYVGLGDWEEKPGSGLVETFGNDASGILDYADLFIMPFCVLRLSGKYDSCCSYGVNYQNYALDGCVAAPVSTPTATATPPVQTPTVTPGCAVTVSGQVCDAPAGPGQGIAGAQVVVHLDVPRTFSATADGNGRYSLLVPEPYACRVVSVEAAAYGYAATRVPVTPAALVAQPMCNFALRRP